MTASGRAAVPDLERPLSDAEKAVAKRLGLMAMSPAEVRVRLVHHLAVKHKLPDLQPMASDLAEQYQQCLGNGHDHDLARAGRCWKEAKRRSLIALFEDVYGAQE